MEPESEQGGIARFSEMRLGPSKPEIQVHAETQFDAAAEDYMTCIELLWNSFAEEDDAMRSVAVPMVRSSNRLLRNPRVAEQHKAMRDHAQSHADFAATQLGKSFLLGGEEQTSRQRWATYVQILSSWRGNIDNERMVMSDDECMAPTSGTIYHRMKECVAKMQDSALTILTLIFMDRGMLQTHASLIDTLAQFADKKWADAIVEEMMQGKSIASLEPALKEYSQMVLQLNKQLATNATAEFVAQNQGLIFTPPNLSRLRMSKWMNPKLEHLY